MGRGNRGSKPLPNISKHVIEDYIPDYQQSGDIGNFVFLSRSQGEGVDVVIDDDVDLPCAQAVQKSCPRAGVSYAAAVKSGIPSNS